MRLCTAHLDAYVPAKFAGTTSWSEGMVRLSINALVINDQPRGY